MKPEDVKVGMKFGGVDMSGYWLRVEGLDGPHALCHVFTCFNSGKEKVLLTDLVDTRFFEEFHD